MIPGRRSNQNDLRDLLADRVMRLLVLITVAGQVALHSTHGAAQPVDPEIPDLSQEATREEWQSQIKAAQERAQIVRRERKTSTSLPPTRTEIDAEASRKAFEDNSLRSGDIVFTNRGVYRFQGDPDRERRPDDFVRIR